MICTIFHVLLKDKSYNIAPIAAASFFYYFFRIIKRDTADSGTNRLENTKRTAPKNGTF
jgi:hypothetical protein